MKLLDHKNAAKIATGVIFHHCDIRHANQAVPVSNWPFISFQHSIDGLTVQLLEMHEHTAALIA